MALPPSWARLLRPVLWTVGTAVLAWAAARVAVDRTSDAARAALLGYAPTYAQSLAAMGHSDLPERVSPDDAAYLEMIASERRWETANPRVRDIWTLRKVGDDRVVHLVDAESDFNQNGAIDTAYEHRLPPGAIDASPLSASARRAFRGDTDVDFTVLKDARGSVVEGWAPIRGDDGRVTGVVGVAFDAWPIQVLFTAAACLAGGLVAAWGLGLGLLLRIRAVQAEARQRLAEAAFLRDESIRSQDAASLAIARTALRTRTMLDAMPLPAALRTGDRVFPNPALAARLGSPVDTVESFFRVGWGTHAATARAFYEADRAAGFPEPRVLTLGETRRPHRWIAAADADQELWLFLPETAAAPMVAPIDRPDADALLSPDEPVLDGLTRSFVEDLPDRVAAISDAALRPDPEAAELLAEHLADSAGAYGFATIARAARRLRETCHDAECPEAVEARLGDLAQAARLLHDRLRDLPADA